MKIWVDMLTPKQLLFFRPLVEELENRGHKVLATTRSYRELEGLMKKLGFHARLIGRHGGGALISKLEASLERTLGLAPLISQWGPDAALSFCSPDSARVAYGLAIPHICVSDSPHAEHVSRLTLPLATLLLTPWIIPLKAWREHGIGPSKIRRYRALDPAVWLKRRRADSEGRRFGLKKHHFILIRLEESYAAYLRGVKTIDYASLVRAIGKVLPKHRIVVLPRYEGQSSQIQKSLAKTVEIPQGVVDGASLTADAALFIGMGGTMTAEAALLGTPTISLYPGEPTYVERFLVSQGLVFRPRNLTAVVKMAAVLTENEDKRRSIEAKARRLLDSMEDPVPKIVETVEELSKR